MIRRLTNIFIVLSLVAGCGAAALAAVVCPHTLCLDSALPRAATAEESHDDDSSRAHTAEHDVYTTERAGANHQQMGAHCGGGDDDDGAHGPAARTGEARPSDRALSNEGDSCGHCIGRSTTPAREVELSFDAAKRGGHIDVAPDVAPAISLSHEPVREVTPHQGAPPGGVSRHVLINVFRI